MEKIFFHRYGYKTRVVLHRTEDTFETAVVSILVMLQCMWSGFLPHTSLLALHGLLLSPK